MSIEHILMRSREMDRVKAYIKALAGIMTFDSEMESKNWVKIRKKSHLMHLIMHNQKGVEFDTIKVGRSVEVLTASYGLPSDDHIILYIFGGGFVTGNAFDSKSFASMLAKFSGNRVFVPNYSLAPENKFPKAFEECSRTFEWIIDKYPNAKVSIIGESAGGNLSLALGHRFKYTGRIASISAHSPVVDFSGSVDRSINEKEDFFVKPGGTEPLVRMYIGDEDVTLPYVSPILGDFRDYPPVYITCDSKETMFADSKELYEKCQAAGVMSHLVIADEAFHAFGVTGVNAPETAEVLQNNIDFMKGNYKWI